MTTKPRALALAGVAALGLTLSPAAPTHAEDPEAPLARLTVTTDSPEAGAGNIFVAPYSASGTYASSAQILSPDGSQIVWSHRAAEGNTIADFRAQTYRGQQVLTFWEGTGLGGLAEGTNYIYDNHYRLLGTVDAGHGYHADGHEFLITRRNTALVLAYTTDVADLTAIGGPADQTVINGVVQEVNIKTGRVLFEWNSADHVPYSESQQPLPADAATPWDWFHINAVKQDGPDLLIDARNTWTAYNVNARTGEINWKLGGKNSSFDLQAAPGETLNDSGDIFAWQHDTEAQGHGIYTVFDNEAAGLANTGTEVNSELDHSRAVKIRIDFRHGTATVIDSADQPQGELAPSQGNTQLLGNGNLFTGWGSLPEVSESAPDGDVVFDAHFPDGVNTYRAYRAVWKPAARH